MGFLLANLLKVPLPDLRGNGLTNGTQNTQVSHLVVDVLVTGTLEQTQGGGGNVELGDLVLVDHIPVAGEVGVGRGTLEDDGGASQEQRSIDDVGVTSDPADITTTEEAVIVVDVKDVLAGQSSTQEVTCGGVHDTLGLSGGTGGVEQEQRVFRVDGLGRQVVRVFLDLLVPPDVTAGGPGDLSTGTLVDEHAGNIRALLKSLVDNTLGTNDLTTTTALVSGDDDLGASVQHTIAQRVGGETGKDDGVNGSDTGDGEEGNDGLGNHRKVDSNSVTLLDTLLLQSPGDTGDLTQQFTVGDGATLIGLVSLVDDGDLVGVLDSVTVDTVEGGVQATLNEPSNVTVLEGTVAGSLEVLVEGKVLTGHAGPEGVGAANGLIVELLVFIEVFEVSACRVFLVEGLGDIEGVDIVGLRNLLPRLRWLVFYILLFWV